LRSLGSHLLVRGETVFSLQAKLFYDVVSCHSFNTARHAYTMCKMWVCDEILDLGRKSSTLLPNLCQTIFQKTWDENRE
jgi:hypothetical protein